MVSLSFCSYYSDFLHAFFFCSFLLILHAILRIARKIRRKLEISATHNINKCNKHQKANMRIKDSHPCILVMSQLCYYYINPHVLWHIILYLLIKQLYDPEGIWTPIVIVKIICLNHWTTGPKIWVVRYFIKI